MSEKEIRAKYEARKCETQMEFDRVMSEMNAAFRASLSV